MGVRGGDDQLAEVEPRQLLLNCCADRQQNAGPHDGGVHADDDCRIQRLVAVSRFQRQDIGRQGVFDPLRHAGRKLAREKRRHVRRNITTGRADVQRRGLGMRRGKNRDDHQQAREDTLVRSHDLGVAGGRERQGGPGRSRLQERAA